MMPAYWEKYFLILYEIKDTLSTMHSHYNAFILNQINFIGTVRRFNHALIKPVFPSKSMN